MKKWVYVYGNLQTQITQINKYSRTELLYVIHVIQIVNDGLTLGECCSVRRRLCFFLYAELPFGLARSLLTPDCIVPDVAEFRLPRTYCCQEGDSTKLQPCRRCWAVWRDRRTSMSGWVEQFPRVYRWGLDTRLHPIVPAESFWFSLQTKTNHCSVSYDKKLAIDWLIDSKPFMRSKLETSTSNGVFRELISYSITPKLKLSARAPGVCETSTCRVASQQMDSGASHRLDKTAMGKVALFPPIVTLNIWIPPDRAIFSVKCWSMMRLTKLKLPW